MELPTFRYHPDPVCTGNVVPSDKLCVVCEQARGYVYIGSLHPREEYADRICPWCIADGSAHEKLDVIFFDYMQIGRLDEDMLPLDVSQAVIDEIVFRTPGFSVWQQEEWFTHCGDAAAFLGTVGFEELQTYGEDAIEAIRDNTGFGDDDEWEAFFEKLDKDGAPRAYLFRCLHCGIYGGYTDTD